MIQYTTNPLIVRHVGDDVMTQPHGHKAQAAQAGLNSRKDLVEVYKNIRFVEMLLRV
jgi:hypothetical protein